MVDTELEEQPIERKAPDTCGDRFGGDDQNNHAGSREAKRCENER
jgi:hypothetical protein